MVQLDTQLLTILGGLLIPLVVGLLAKSTASAGLKAILNAGLSAVAGAVATATQTGGVVNWRTYLFNILLAWVTSIATHFGFWKPTGIGPAVINATPTFGLGPKGPVHVDPSAPPVVVNGVPVVPEVTTEFSPPLSGVTPATAEVGLSVSALSGLDLLKRAVAALEMEGK